MRALWVDAGNDADWTKAQRERFTALFYALSDTPGDLARKLRDSKARGYAGGVYMASNWDPFDGLDGSQMAGVTDTLCDQLDTALGRLNLPGLAYKVQFDIEEHDPVLVFDCLDAWRAVRPKQDTSWTLESFQAGWMPADFVEAVVNLKVRVVPQAYTGPMYPVCTRAVCKNLEAAGFPSSIVSPFYDAARLPAYWDGFAFTQGRLP